MLELYPNPVTSPATVDMTLLACPTSTSMEIIHIRADDIYVLSLPIR